MGKRSRHARGKRPLVVGTTGMFHGGAAGLAVGDVLLPAAELRSVYAYLDPMATYDPELVYFTTAALSGGSLVRRRKWRTAHVKHVCSTWAYSGGLTLRGQARRASSWRRECWWMRAHAAQRLSRRVL